MKYNKQDMEVLEFEPRSLDYQNDALGHSATLDDTTFNEKVTT